MESYELVVFIKEDNIKQHLQKMASAVFAFIIYFIAGDIISTLSAFPSFIQSL